MQWTFRETYNDKHIKTLLRSLKTCRRPVGHNDLNERNVLVDQTTGTVKLYLVDFGESFVLPDDVVKSTKLEAHNLPCSTKCKLLTRTFNPHTLRARADREADYQGLYSPAAKALEPPVPRPEGMDPFQRATPSAAAAQPAQIGNRLAMMQPPAVGFAPMPLFAGAQAMTAPVIFGDHGVHSTPAAVEDGRKPAAPEATETSPQPQQESASEQASTRPPEGKESDYISFGGTWYHKDRFV
ncbi:MAG: hypothetical protein KTR20_13690 [Cellvibrionaceae bacterium]|nr:hypothetical protein [Cellvibrionaceae bacterium]